MFLIAVSRANSELIKTVCSNMWLICEKIFVMIFFVSFVTRNSTQKMRQYDNYALFVEFLFSSLGDIWLFTCF